MIQSVVFVMAYRCMGTTLAIHEATEKASNVHTM